MMTHSQSAPMTVSKEPATSMSTPIRAQPPIRLPMISISVGQLTRRGSARVGSSTAGGAIGGSFGADDHRGGRDGAGQVAVELILRGPLRGVAEVRQDNGARHRV